MPPRRPLPDLCLIAVFQMQTANDQLMASKMSPRGAMLVRAANRHVKSLVITSADMKQTHDRIKPFLLASVPSMKLLKDAGETFLDYPVTTSHLSKWNCMQLDNFETLDQSTIEQIVNNFSAVSELKCIFNESTKKLVVLLKHPQWANQLTNLMVVGLDYMFELNQNVYTAINELSALQCLALKSHNDEAMPDMPIFKQLKVIAVDLEFSYGSSNFLAVLGRCASGNVDLQVNLLSIDKEASLSISESTGRQIVRCRGVYDYPSDQVFRLCQVFPALTSLSVEIFLPYIVPLFTALSQLSQLVHLGIDYVARSFEEQQMPLLVQLPSVRALDLSRLHITSHSQLKVLNLQWTLPNLQVISLSHFRCRSCDVHLRAYLLGHYKEDSKQTSAALKCFRETLAKLHSGVPPERIIVNSNEPYTFLDQLLQSAGN